MSKLTSKISELLLDQPNKKLIKDLTRNVWLTRFQVEQAVQQLLNFFHEKKLQPEDKILLSCSNSILYPLVVLAANQYGLVVHPAAPTLTITEFNDLLTDTDFKLVFPAEIQVPWLHKKQAWRKNELALLDLDATVVFNKTSALAKAFNDSAAPTDNTPSILMYTSGTTGTPKKVILNHANLLAAAQYVIKGQSLTENDCTLVVLPLFHINALIIVMLSTILSGGKLIIPAKFSASHFWQQVKQEKVTWVSVSPSVISILLINQQAQKNFSPIRSLRFLRSASAPLSAKTQRRFEDRYQVPIIQGYGMTEAAGQICVNPLDHPKYGSVGKPVGTQVSVLFDGKLTLRPHVTGEVVLKGKNVISMYVGRNSAQDFIAGWLKTGDTGYFDEEGYLFLTGRTKDLINYGGHKISPIKVETVLLQADFVIEVAVVGIPDQIFGEKIVAAIVLKKGIVQQVAREKLTRIIRTNLAEFERPKQLIFIPKIPRNRIGKILRIQLQRELSS